MEKTGGIESDGEDDCEGYILEPSGCNINISEKIAEANRRLFEEASAAEEDEETRTKKVQFCETLVDFEPPQPEYYYDDAESVSSEEDSSNKPLQTISEIKESDESNESNQHSPDLIFATEELKDDSFEDTVEESIPDEADVVTAEDMLETVKKEEIHLPEVAEEQIKEPEVVNSSKVLVVVMPRDQCSSFEGEDIQEESEIGVVEEDEKEQTKEVPETKPRPKSANKSTKAKKTQKMNCKMATIAPELDCSVEAENKSWHESQRLKYKGGAVDDSKRGKEVAVDKKVEKQGVIQAELVEKERPGTSREVERGRSLPPLRPKTAPTKRPCCPVRTNLPRYNGLRSEYGLSSDQLQERRRKIAEAKQHRREEELSKRNETTQKRQENEAKFSQWLDSKSGSRSRSSSTASSSKNLKKDTLVRSDVFIQKNAAYASKCGVAYAVNYSLGKSKSKIQEIRRKTVSLGKLFENLSPHAQKTYRIYLDAK